MSNPCCLSIVNNLLRLPLSNLQSALLFLFSVSFIVASPSPPLRAHLHALTCARVQTCPMVLCSHQPDTELIESHFYVSRIPSTVQSWPTVSPQRSCPTAEITRRFLGGELRSFKLVSVQSLLEYGQRLKWHTLEVCAVASGALSFAGLSFAAEVQFSATTADESGSRKENTTPWKEV